MKEKFYTHEIKTIFSGDFIMKSNQLFGAANLQHQTIATTATCAHYLGYKNIEDALGKCAYSIPSEIAKNAPNWHRQNRHVTSDLSKIEIIDIHSDDNQQLQCHLAKKWPLVDSSDEQPTGVVFASQPYNTKLTDIIQDYKKYLPSPKQISLSFELVDRYTEFNLTQRESGTLYFLMRGYTAKGIANHLQLSNRTVEAYIESIKSKMNCRKKSIIIECAIASGLLNKMPRSLAI